MVEAVGVAGWGGSGDPLLAAPGAALADLRAALAGAGAAVGLSSPLAGVQAALVDVHALIAVAEAVKLTLVRAAEDREPLAGVGRRRVTGSATIAWMSDHLKITAGQAHADLNAARATDPDAARDPRPLLGGFGHRGVLSGLGAALAGGQVSRCQVDVGVRTMQHLPTRLVATRGAEVDALLTAHATQFPPSLSTQLAEQIRQTLDPTGIDEEGDDATERRHLLFRRGAGGSWRVEGVLDAEAGAEVKTLIEALASPDRPVATTLASGEDPQLDVAGLDQRSTPQRAADALVEACRRARSTLGDSPTAEGARIVVHCTPDQLAHPDPHHGHPCPHHHPDTDIVDADAYPCADAGADVDAAGAQEQRRRAWRACLAPGAAVCEATGPISARLLQRLACDAVIQRVVLDRHGAVVRMDSVERLASRGMRRALAARDRGCRWPGCTAPPSRCEVHHVVWWSRGGQTVIANLCLLCQRHHSEIHREQWVIIMREGVPWFIPPRWLDPDQTPRRNTFHDAMTATRLAGQRWRHNQPLPDPPDDADPPDADPPNP